MKGRAGRIVGSRSRHALTAALAAVLVIILLPPSIAFPTSLADEASRLRTASIKNLSTITTLSLSCRVTVTKLDSTGTATTASATASPASEQSLWDRKGKKLKRKQGRGDIISTVADGQAVTLAIQTSSTVIVEPIPPEGADSATTPSPFWFWRPDKFIPEKPAAVREDGQALVLSSSQGNPKREIWLDRATGRIARFEDTSAAGSKYRVVVCQNWTKVSNVWIPLRIEEEVRARQNGIRRIIEFTETRVNPAVSEDAFILP